MFENNSISSTEKLLEFIKKKEDDPIDSSDSTIKDSAPGLPHLHNSTIKPSLKDIFSFKKRITVGIDIGTSHLNLVKIRHYGCKKFELIGFYTIPFEQGITEDSNQMALFLRSVLAEFCGNSKHVRIWSTVPTTQVKIRYLTIPNAGKKQVYTAVHWKYAKEITFDEEEFIFDFRVFEKNNDDKEKKKDVIAFAVPRKKVEDLNLLLKKAGYPPEGITIVPFVLQNLMKTRWINARSENVCSIFVGKDWSRIVIFSMGALVLSRDIKFGIRSMVEAIKMDTGESNHVLSIDESAKNESVFSDRAEKSSIIDMEQASQIFLGLIHDSSFYSSRIEDLDIKKERLFAIMLPALDRLCRQIERTFDHFSHTQDSKSVDWIYLTGKVAMCQPFTEYIGKHLQIPIDTMDPFEKSEFIAQDIPIPGSLSERDDLISAVGMALSDNELTPNLIYTYKEKEKVASILRVTRLVSVVLFGIMILCIAFYYQQSNIYRQKSLQITRLQQEIGEMNPRVDANFLLANLSRIGEKKQALKNLADRYELMAILSEISDLTPDDIRLTDIDIRIGSDARISSSDTRKEQEQNGGIVYIEGAVTGDELSFNSMLISYLAVLKESVLFGNPIVDKTFNAKLKDHNILRFKIVIKLVRR